MRHSWIKTVFPIAAIFSFRLLGLFMLIPVFTLYAPQLQNATPWLIGLALGTYGLTQGLLQIPFGLLSDRFGRKPMITIGLVLFAIGSLAGAFAHSIESMILARAFQGAGAIGGVLIALLADLTPDNQRTQAMAVIGMTIGISFSLAMMISPIIAEISGLPGIFYVTAAMALAAIALLHLVIPTPPKDPFHKNIGIDIRQFLPVFKNNHLQRLNIGIFFQHLMLTSTFFVIPILLKQYIQDGKLHNAWQFYLPLMIAAFLIMIPIIVFGERQKQLKIVLMVSIGITAFSQCILAYSSASWGTLCTAMLLYFIAFNVLEASLPSLVSRQAGIENKGTATGIYSSSQFLGIFAGGVLAGMLFKYGGNTGVFLLNTGISLVWFGIAAFMQPYAYEFTITLTVLGPIQDRSAVEATLLQLAGVNTLSIEQQEITRIHLRVAKDRYIDGSAEGVLKHFSLK